MLSAELPPWLLPLEVAQRIGNEYRVRVGLIQAIARAVAAASASRAYTYDEIIRYGRICWQLARATVSELEPMPAVDLIDDPAAFSGASMPSGASSATSTGTSRPGGRGCFRGSSAAARASSAHRWPMCSTRTPRRARASACGT
jgi:hypothetical protein